MNNETLKKLVLAIYAAQEECRDMNNGGGSCVAGYFIRAFEGSDKTDLESRIADAAENVFIRANKWDVKFLEIAKKDSGILLEEDGE